MLSLPRGDKYSFCAFFHIYKQFYSKWMEQIIEPHAYLLVNDLAPLPPPPPSISCEKDDITTFTWFRKSTVQNMTGAANRKNVLKGEVRRTVTVAAPGLFG
jgi:hypothetical protein